MPRVMRMSPVIRRVVRGGMVVPGVRVVPSTVPIRLRVVVVVTVIRGNLLVIPIGESLLYAEPIYLQAASLAFPELKRVILATNDDVVMEETLDDAVRAILGGARPDRTDDAPVSGGIAPDDLLAIVDELRTALNSFVGGAEALDSSLDALEKLAKEAQP